MREEGRRKREGRRVDGGGTWKEARKEKDWGVMGEIRTVQERGDANRAEGLRCQREGERRQRI